MASLPSRAARQLEICMASLSGSPWTCSGGCREGRISLPEPLGRCGRMGIDSQPRRGPGRSPSTPLDSHQSFGSPRPVLSRRLTRIGFQTGTVAAGLNPGGSGWPRGLVFKTEKPAALSACEMLEIRIEYGNAAIHTNGAASSGQGTLAPQEVGISNHSLNITRRGSPNKTALTARRPVPLAAHRGIPFAPFG